MRRIPLIVSLGLVGLLGHGAATAAPVAVATWNFNNTLAADEAGRRSGAGAHADGLLDDAVTRRRQDDED